MLRIDVKTRGSHGNNAILFDLSLAHLAYRGYILSLAGNYENERRNTILRATVMPSSSILFKTRHASFIIKIKLEYFALMQYTKIILSSTR